MTNEERNRLTPEEARALEVVKCARSAVLDAATLCARAGLFGSQVMGPLDDALRAMQYVADTIEGKN